MFGDSHPLPLENPSQNEKNIQNWRNKDEKKERKKQVEDFFVFGASFSLTMGNPS